MWSALPKKDGFINSYFESNLWIYGNGYKWGMLCVGVWACACVHVCKTFRSSILATRSQPARCAWSCRRSRLRVSTCDLCPWRGFRGDDQLWWTPRYIPSCTIYILGIIGVYWVELRWLEKSDYGCSMILLSSDLIRWWIGLRNLELKKITLRL